MGMGEPFHNYEAVMDAVALLNDPHGFGLGHRHITISTVGLADIIDRFTDEGCRSISRSRSTRRTMSSAPGSCPSIESFRSPCSWQRANDTSKRRNRKVFFEYVMLAGVNDDPAHAHELAALLRGHLYHVNLIPYNSTPDAPYQATPDARIWEFARVLEAAGLPVTVRQNMGRDIAAACGQLQAETQPKAHALSS